MRFGSFSFVFVFTKWAARGVWGGNNCKKDVDDVRRQTSSCGGMVAKYSVVYCAKAQPSFQATILCVMKAACLLKTSVLKRLFRRSRSLEKRWPCDKQHKTFYFDGLFSIACAFLWGNNRRYCWQMQVLSAKPRNICSRNVCSILEKSCALW